MSYIVQGGKTWVLWYSQYGIVLIFEFGATLAMIISQPSWLALLKNCPANWVISFILDFFFFWEGILLSSFKQSWPSWFSNWAALDTLHVPACQLSPDAFAAPDLVCPFFAIHPLRIACQSSRGSWEVSIRRKKEIQSTTRRLNQIIGSAPTTWKLQEMKRALSRLRLKMPNVCLLLQSIAAKCSQEQIEKCSSLSWHSSGESAGPTEDPSASVEPTL